MKKQFLTDYLISTNKRFATGFINLIVSHAGSGKSHFITGEKGLIKNTKQFYSEGKYKFFNFEQQKQKVLIITDNLMNRDVFANIGGFQEFNYTDFYKAQNLNLFNEILTGDTGVVNVMTYAKFLTLLTHKNTSKIITSYIDLIIFDEVHNLFDYSLKFDKDEDKTGYFTIIENINTLSKNALVVGLTATPHKIQVWMNNYTNDINFKGILGKDELDNIISYTELDKRKYYSIDNAITDLCNNRTSDKVLIYTKKIATCKIYKERLTQAGYNVEYLCAEHKLNDEQKQLKQYLIEHETLPPNLNILIINEAYQTGWNLKDDSVQIVIVNDSDETAIIQARNRIRHDIKTLIVKLYDVDIDVYRTYDFNNQMSFVIDDEYLNRPLTTEEFNIVKERYGTIRPIVNDKGLVRGYCSKSDFINKDLESNGYIYKDKMIIEVDAEKLLYKELEEYLQSCIGKRLYKEEQQELIEMIGLKDNKGRIQKQVSTLNGYLTDNFNMTLISKVVRENNKRKTVWLIDK